jgi:membrane-associated phospholipid phosphatase
MNRTSHVPRYVAIMLGVYVAWGALYLATAWIGQQRGPAFDAAIALDAQVPFIPAFQHVYMLAYVIVFGLFAISREPAFLNRAYAAFILANGVAFVIFALFPVMGPVRDAVIARGEDLSVITRLILAVDSRYNAFPSLHVTNPWLVALMSAHARGAAPITWVFMAIAVGITVSTLFVHQHYILDAVAGMVLAGAAYLVVRAWRPVGGRLRPPSTH